MSFKILSFEDGQKKRHGMLQKMMSQLEKEQSERTKYWLFTELLIDAIKTNGLEDVVITFLDEEAKLEREYGYTQYDEEIFRDLKHEIRTRWDFLNKETSANE